MSSRPARRPLRQPPFLPVSRAEMDALGWNELDILLISGDAYVDHPSFGAALLGRFLVERGFRAGIIAQPRWHGPEAIEDIARLGRPRLFAGVTAGAVDSMLARYTAFRKQRADDAYTPGGRAGARPNRAVIVYANLARQAFPGLPLVLGGIEASLRRASHYDFWTDSLRGSILLDAKADVLVCGMGESALEALANAAEDAVFETGGTGPEETGSGGTGPEGTKGNRAGPGRPGAFVRAALAARVRDIPGVAYAVPAKDAAALAKDGAVVLPSHEEILSDSFLLVTATVALERQVHQGIAKAVQMHGGRAVIMNPPAPPLGTKDLDELYGLPFSRLPHPSYTEPVPAWEMIRASVTSHRGCGGGCAFCSLALHQTRRIASRSKESVLAETRRIASSRVNGKVPPWAGSITDIGGPSANMWQARCAANPETCERQSCLFPAVCPAFRADQGLGAAMLREAARQEGVRHVRVASGVRFDLALKDKNALAAYTAEFTGGQLKIAPEHIAEDVLRLMRKPPPDVFERFLDGFSRISASAGKEQYVIPYLMSAHPGCTDEHMRRLSRWLKERNWSPKQVQCFIPTPGTVATAMFFAGKDTEGNPIPVARTDAERMRQHYILLGEPLAGALQRGAAPRPAGGNDSPRPPASPACPRGSRPVRDRGRRDSRRR